MSKLNAKLDADSFLYSVSHSECDGHTVHMLTQWYLLPTQTGTVKLSLFTHAHPSPLSLAARLHWCCTNSSHCIHNGWTFSRCTLYFPCAPFLWSQVCICDCTHPFSPIAQSLGSLWPELHLLPGMKPDSLCPQMSVGPLAQLFPYSTCFLINRANVSYMPRSALLFFHILRLLVRDHFPQSTPQLGMATELRCHWWNLTVKFLVTYVERKCLPCTLSFFFPLGNVDHTDENSTLRSVFCRYLEIHEALSGGLKCQTVFIIRLRCYLSFLLPCICIVGEKAVVCKTAGALAWTKAGTASCTQE